MYGKWLPRWMVLILSKNLAPSYLSSGSSALWLLVFTKNKRKEINL